MNIEFLKTEVAKLLAKHNDLHLAVLGFAFTDEQGNLCTHGYTLIRQPPKDHEEELVRDNTAKKISTITADLVKDTYGS